MIRSSDSTDDGRKFVVELSPSERYLLAQAVLQAVGPARLTVDFVHALGFRDQTQFSDDAIRLHDALRAGIGLTRTEWTQSVLLTEIVWASNEIGAASEWDAVTDITDLDALTVLRNLQRTLAPIVDATLLQRPH